MIHSDPRLNRILRRLVLRSFPGLRLVPIRISWGANDEFLYYTLEREGCAIGVHECLRNAPTLVVRGGIVHELCHIDADLKLGPYQRQLAWDRYSNSRFSRMREERAIDRRVLELGYGRDLLAFIRFAYRLGYGFTREQGLTFPEIQRVGKTRRPG